MTITADQLHASLTNGYRTLKDIANDFGVTRERIRQLCAKYDIDRGDKPWETHTPSYWKRSRWPREGLFTLKRQLGLCASHGCYEPRKPARHRCSVHLNTENERQKHSQTNRRENGLCWHCGQPPVPGRTMCQHHLNMLKVTFQRHYRDHYAPRMKALYQARRAAGVCTVCGRREAQPSRATCEPCARRINASLHARRNARQVPV